MIRETSINAFHMIRDNGILGMREFQVYEAICNNGSVTIKETCMILKPIPETSISPIFSRLERKGLIKIQETRKCKITGNNVYSWQSTNKMPNDKPPRKASYQELEKFVLDEYRYLLQSCEMNSDNFEAYHGLRDSWKNKLTTMRILE